jgi:hypothetical protein
MTARYHDRPVSGPTSVGMSDPTARAWSAGHSTAPIGAAKSARFLVPEGLTASGRVPGVGS